MVVSIQFSKRKISRMPSFKFSYLFVAKLLALAYLGHILDPGGYSDVTIPAFLWIFWKTVISIQFSMRQISRVPSFKFSYVFALKLLRMMHLGVQYLYWGGRCDVIIWVLMLIIFRNGCYDWICHTKFIKNTKFSSFITFSSYVINILRSFYNSWTPGDVTS